MNDDGSGIRRLTNNTLSADRYPRWSPDGKRIAFHRYMDKERMQTSSELFIMNADGTDQKRLTHNTVADGYPSWSPDGQYLAFHSGRSGKGKSEVYVIELASQRVQRLTGTKGELILIPNLNVTYNPIESGDGLNNVWMSLKIKQAFN